MTTSGPTETAQPDATRPTWLVMVYMQAGDNSQLDNLAIQDLFEAPESDPHSVVVPAEVGHIRSDAGALRGGEERAHHRRAEFPLLDVDAHPDRHPGPARQLQLRPIHHR